MERCRLSEEERRIYERRMSRALLFEAAEAMRLCSPEDESKGEKS